MRCRQYAQYDSTRDITKMSNYDDMQKSYPIIEHETPYFELIWTYPCAKRLGHPSPWVRTDADD